MTTIIHIEDDFLWADIVRAKITSFAEFRLLGTASNGTEGLAKCRALAPQIVILDLRLPDMDGLVVIDALRAFRTPPKMILFTARADEATIARLFREPVAGMIWKSPTFGPELQRALTTIAGGGTHYSPDLLREWCRFTALPDSWVKILSNTELRLLPHLSQGCTDAEVAALVGSAISTVHTHRKTSWPSWTCTRRRRSSSGR